MPQRPHPSSAGSRGDRPCAGFTRGRARCRPSALTSGHSQTGSAILPQGCQAELGPLEPQSPGKPNWEVPFSPSLHVRILSCSLSGFTSMYFSVSVYFSVLFF